MAENIGLVVPILCPGIVFLEEKKERRKARAIATVRLCCPASDQFLIFFDWKILALGGLSERWCTEDGCTIVPSRSEQLHAVYGYEDNSFVPPVCALLENKK
jgi:hypothetical protein